MLCRKLLSISLLSVFAVAALAPTISAQTLLRRGDHVPDELLIVPQDGVSEAEVVNLYQTQGGRSFKKVSKIKAHRVKLSPQSLDAVEAALKKNPKVKIVERNYLAKGTVIPNDPGFSSQWHLPKISAPAGWEITVGSRSVAIAIIDSGVDPTHPDLQSKLLPGYNFIQNNADTRDVEGHGTAVAGTAAALTDSGIGVAGVAWDSAILPLSVLNSSGYGTYADLAEAITYAADHGAKVINLSLGGPSYSATLQNAVDYAWSKGAVIVASAGNEASSAPLYPAALNNVVAVSATDSTDRLASFSSFGNWVDVAAPGTSIYTTNNGGSYGFWSGTSFSSPVVAGLIALVFSVNPSLTNAEVIDILKNSADDLGVAGYDPSFGYGRVNAARALETAKALVQIDVAITSPGQNNSVGGIVPVDVSANADVGVSQVELYVDGVLSGAAATAPYSFLWDTSELAGSHTLLAKAYDSSGQEASSLPVTVSVVQPNSSPDVQISVVLISSTSVTVNVSASDSDGDRVRRLELYLDGVRKDTAKSSSKNFRLSIRRLPAGTHALTAKAIDAKGNVGTSTPVAFVK